MSALTAPPPSTAVPVPPRDRGVNLPCTGGRRSSTSTARSLLTGAVGPFDPAAAARIARTPAWRHGYPSAFVEVTRAEAASPEAALGIARNGLAAARRELVWVTEGGDLPLAAGFADRSDVLRTASISGTGRRETRLTVPYRGEQLHGDALLRQLDRWVRRGVTEPSFAEAVGAVVRNPDWLDLTDRTFALVGAGAAMGPFTQLMRWGATVAAVDLPRPQIWERLVAQARGSAGTLLVPVRDGGALVAAAGADLLTEAAAVASWLAGVPGPVTIGNYGYADGALFVRLTMAFDLLVEDLAAARRDLSLAYLATPSDAFLVPADAVRSSARRRRTPRPGIVAAAAVNRLGRGERFRPAHEQVLDTATGRYGLVDAFIVEQGPNYALAKRLQRWRMVASRAEGMLTSVHVAPPTRTMSVHKNPEMAERQRLLGRAGFEAFDAATSQALGAAILVHDLRNPGSPANPEVPLAHPHEAFMFAANPGGRWRAPYEPGSVLPALRKLDRLRHAG